MISVQLSANEGSGLYFSSNWTNYKTIEQDLNGGTIQVGTGKQLKGGANDEEITLNNILRVYPNPFHTNATIHFNLEESNNTTIIVTNSLGNIVNELVRSELSAGEYTINWDGLGFSGEVLSSGVYFITLKTDTFSRTVPITLIK